MKKLLFTAALLVFVGFAATAQEQGDIRVNAGLAIGTKAGVDEGGEKAGFGVNLGGEYLITDKISVAPSYTFFFESSIDVLGFESSIQLSSLNIDGRYYFLSDDLQVYGLAGVSFASATATVDLGAFGGTQEVDSNDTGLNIGAGALYPFSDNFFGHVQVKYNTPAEQLVAQFGVAFGF